MRKKPNNQASHVKSTSIPPVMILLALALRMIIAFAYGVHQNEPESRTFGDTAEYWTIAANLANGGGMYIVVENRVQQASRPPLYPLFLAAVMNVASADAIRVVVVLQVLMGVLTCWLVYRMAKGKFGERAGRLAFLLCAVYPFFVFYTGLYLTETLFCLLYVLLNLFLDKTSGRFGPLWGGAAGAALGLGALTRSELFLFPFIALPLWILAGADKRRRLGSALLATVVMAAVMSPWVIRNASIFNGQIIVGTTRLGHDLYEANNPDADGGIMAERMDREKVAGLKGQAPKPDAEYEAASDSVLTKKAFSWMGENPGKFLALVPQKFWRTWRPVPGFGEFRSWYFMLISLLSYAPVVLLAAAGAWMLRKEARSGLWPFLVPVIFIVLLHCVFLGSMRYNLPAMPFIIILAAVGIDRLLGRRTERQVSG
jgi:4-amino-4-deoxy-L-arabinose transferase-like glycosyltransferase